MKTYLRSIALLLLSVAFCRATPELDSLEGKIRAALPGSEWQIVKDWRSISIVRTNVQFLNPIGLPTLSEAELWNRYAFRSDYRMTIVLGTRLTQSEYDELFTLKRSFTAKRTAGKDPATKDFFGARRDAEGTIRLPDCYSDRFSIYFYTSDEGFFRIRPKSAKNAREMVLAILEQSCSKYSITAEPGGAADRSQPVSSQTNRASAAAGTGR